MLGYAYIVAVFAVLSLLLMSLPRLTHGHGSWLLINPALYLIPIAFVLLRALVVRVPPPRGIVLVRERVPALFSTIGEVAGALSAPFPDRVLLVRRLKPLLDPSRRDQKIHATSAHDSRTSSS